MERAELSQALRAWRSREVGAVIPNGPRRVKDNAPYHLITEPDPRKFMAAFADAVAGSGDIFLCDPKWGAAERAQVDELLCRAADQLSTFNPQLSLPGDRPGQTPDWQQPATVSSQLSALSSQLGWLMIPTGGTGGRVRFARHDAATIAAAVRAFSRHFGLSQINAAGVLPLHHVSGLMAWMRCALTGGEYRPLDWNALEGGALPSLPEKTPGWVLSLVPTQLQRLLQREAAVDWLRKFQIIFLGGGPAWPELLDQAAALKLPLSLSYGMTESAAMLAALHPEEFLAGARNCGAILPHMNVQISGDGQISLSGESLFRGYYPQWRTSDVFETEDGGWLEKDGFLHVSGRRDAVIISGGEKIDPAEVEAVLRGSGELPEVVVLGVPDSEWGQVVIAVYPEPARPNLKKVTEVMSRLLAPAKRPKHFVPLAHWPVNDEGKVNRPEVARRVREKLEGNTKKRSS
jgi:O-succinylbenzoic acid--CoA ligase